MKPRVLLHIDLSVYVSRPTATPNRFLSLRRRAGSWYFGTLTALLLAYFAVGLQLENGWHLETMWLLLVVPLLVCWTKAERKWDSASFRKSMYVELPIPPSEVDTVVRNVRRLDGPDGGTYHVNSWEYRAYDNTYIANQGGTLREHPKVKPGDDLEEVIERFVATEYRQHGWGSYPRLQDQKPYRDPASA